MSGSARRFPTWIGTAALLFVLTTAAYGAPVVHQAQKGHNQEAWHLFAAGPAAVLMLLGSLAVAALIAAGFGGLEKLTRLGARSARRLETGFVVPTIWGICACLLIFALIAVLFATKILGFLGLVVMVLAFFLAGLGTAVAASVYGRGLAVAMDSVEMDDLTSTRLGLWVFLFASAIPLLGWIVVFLAVAGGLGAVLQSLAAKSQT